jgi:hypothetical protein
VNSDSDDTTIIQTLLNSDDTPTRQLRPVDQTRLRSNITIVDANFADLEEFVTGDLREDAYLVQGENPSVHAGRESANSAASYNDYWPDIPPSRSLSLRLTQRYTDSQR